MSIESLYELSGVLGIDPERLFSFTFRELYFYARGVTKQRSKEENSLRKIYYVIAAAHRDPKVMFPTIDQLWPIEGYDRPQVVINLDEKKQQLMKAWRLS